MLRRRRRESSLPSHGLRVNEAGPGIDQQLAYTTGYLRSWRCRPFGIQKVCSAGGRAVGASSGTGYTRPGGNKKSCVTSKRPPWFPARPARRRGVGVVFGGRVPKAGGHLL